jgi:ATP-dependent DNA helicase RecQ
VTARDPGEVLRRVFGFPGFRPLQEQAVRHVAAGGDALVLMPTGGGKSVCYQVPALCRPGTAVVVSPLIALMDDQVAALRQLGVAAGAVQLARSLGSAFGVALAGAALFAALAAMDPRGAALFGELLRHGPGLLAGLGVEERALVQGEIGAAFRALFLTVACFSCAIVAAAVTQPVRRVDRG